MNANSPGTAYGLQYRGYLFSLRPIDSHSCLVAHALRMAFDSG